MLCSIVRKKEAGNNELSWSYFKDIAKLIFEPKWSNSRTYAQLIAYV